MVVPLFASTMAQNVVLRVASDTAECDDSVPARGSGVRATAVLVQAGVVGADLIDVDLGGGEGGPVVQGHPRDAARLLRGVVAHPLVLGDPVVDAGVPGGQLVKGGGWPRPRRSGVGAVAVGLPDGDDVVLAAAHDHALAHVRLLGGIDAPRPAAVLPPGGAGPALAAEGEVVDDDRRPPFQGALRWSPVATS